MKGIIGGMEVLWVSRSSLKPSNNINFKNNENTIGKARNRREESVLFSLETKVLKFCNNWINSGVTNAIDCFNLPLFLQKITNNNKREY